MTDRPDDRGPPGAPTIWSIGTTVEVLKADFASFTREITRRLDNVDGTIKESLGRYATKDDLKDCHDAIADIRGNIKWGVRLVIAAVILAALALIFKSGLLHAP